MALTSRTTDSGQKVYGTYQFKYGGIAFRQNDKGTKFAVVLTRHNNKQISLKSIKESEINSEYNLITAIDNLVTNEIEFISYLMNTNSDDGDFKIVGLTREQFINLLYYIR